MLRQLPRLFEALAAKVAHENQVLVVPVPVKEPLPFVLFPAVHALDAIRGGGGGLSLRPPTPGTSADSFHGH